MPQPKRRRIEQIQTSSNFTKCDITNENLMDQTFDLLGNFFEHQDVTEFPNPTDDEIDILSQMIQQEHPSEKIQKWFPNAPNLDNE